MERMGSNPYNAGSNPASVAVPAAMQKCCPVCSEGGQTHTLRVEQGVTNTLGSVKHRDSAERRANGQLLKWIRW